MHSWKEQGVYGVSVTSCISELIVFMRDVMLRERCILRVKANRKEKELRIKKIESLYILNKL